MVEMKPFTVFVVFLSLFAVSPFCYGGGGGRSMFSGSQKNLNVTEHLNRLNKPPVKTIKSPDGDIIDCVLIKHQPAFDHPSLKNHTIQMRPGYYPNSMKVDDIIASSSKPKGKGISQLWHLNGKCPKGTIPIRRTTEEDILRASSIGSFGNKTFSSLDRLNLQNHIHASVSVDNGEYHGTTATFNIWNPVVEMHDEFSLAQLWINGGDLNTDINAIEVGWQVVPSQYPDSNTRFFIYWTGDGYHSTGCQNLRCPGFIQTNNEIVIGGTIYPVSQINGPQRYLTISVWRDPSNGNWWLQYNGIPIGYFPSDIFTHLRSPAQYMSWGGEVFTSTTHEYHTSTQMGSGLYADQGFGRTGLISNIQAANTPYTSISPMIHVVTEQPYCYDAQSGYSAELGTYMYYGGSGRNQYCP